MSEAFKKRWVLFLVLIIFVVLKYPHLFRSFYWDESWPYASGVMQMYLNGPSLMPGAISGELARGHPLMFHFLGAIWMKIFGTSHVAMHTYPLFISLLFLVAIYEAGLRLFNIRVAITAVLLIASQQIFFVQSAFVLLEILTAFLGFVSIFFYVSRKYALAAISLTMLFYTKESGMIVGFVLGMDALISMLNKKIPLRRRIIQVVTVAIPVILIGLFFLMQKKVSGWYVLPLYSNGLESNYDAFYGKFREGMKLFFRNDHRKYFFLLVLLLSIAAAIRHKKFIYAIPAIGGLIISVFLDDGFHSIVHGKVFPAVASLVFIGVVYLLTKATMTSALQRKLLMLLAIFLICFNIFTAVNLFYIDRYLIMALVPALFIGAVFVNYFLSRISKHLFIPVLIAILAISGWSFLKDRNLGDINMGAFDGLYVHEHIADFMEKNGFHERSVAAEGYLERIHLLDPHSGFLKQGQPFTDVEWEINDGTELVIFDNIEPDLRYDQIKNDRIFKLIYRVQKGNAWGEVYRRR